MQFNVISKIDLTFVGHRCITKLKDFFVRGENMRIICIDDEKLILELTVSMCRELPQKPEVRGFNNSADALAYIRNYKVDIAIMDINMPDMSGIIMAAKMKEINKNVAIIFLTGYSEYALDAISMHASGYLMKPVSMERLSAEIDYAIENIELHKYKPKNTNIFIRTFGRFDVFLDGEPISFQRSRAKELLAYLVDRKGSMVSRATAFSVLWENRTYDRPMQKQFDVILRSLRTTLEKYGISDIIEMKKGYIRAVPEQFDCDLYRFFDGNIDTINSFKGEYMSEYSWASITEANIS